MSIMNAVHEKPASQKQLDFIGSLIETREVPAKSVAHVEYMADEGISTRIASMFIESFLSMPYRKSEAPATATGFYAKDGNVYKVKISQNDRPYALKLESGSWEYASGVAYKLTDEHKLTLEEAKKYGQETGVCCMCGRVLTNENSIAEGLGPICAGKFG